MPVDKGTGSRARRPKPRPEDIHDRPTALSKRQQYEQAQARREAAAQTPKGATARQRNIAAQEKAREPARYGADVRRQVANPSIADRLAEGFFRGAVQAPLYTNLPGAMIGQAYALMPEERGKAPTSKAELLNIAMGHVGGITSRPGQTRGPKQEPPDPLVGLDESALSARAVELDNAWRKRVETISESLFGKPSDRGKAETAKRNAERERLGKRGVAVPTVRAENFAEAENRVLRFLEEHVDDPRFRKVIDEIEERARIAQRLAALADSKLGLGGVEASVVQTPKATSPSLPPPPPPRKPPTEDRWPGGGEPPEPLFGISDVEAARAALLAAARRSRGPSQGPSGKFEKGLYNQQADLRRQERGKRAAAAEAARVAAGGGRAGSYAALRELKGALPRLKTGGLNLEKNVEDSLFDAIGNHPDLLSFEKRSAEAALRDLIDGKVLAPRQWRWIEDLFGKDVAKQAIKNLPLGEKIKRELLGALNIPRALKSTGDLSLMFRQVLVAGARHPKLWARTWKPMTKSGLSEQHYNVVMDDIASHPLYDEAVEDGLSLTDLENMVRREEGYMSDRAEQIPLGVGRLVRASGRAFTAGGNMMRMWMYALMRETHPNMSKEDRASMVSWINAATGRGAKQGGHFQQNAQVYNGLLFSPQLVASRIKLLNPFWYTGVPKIHKGLQGPARTEALRGMIQLGVAATATLAMVDEVADQMGWGDRVSVELDPRSSDWGKIRVGDTRIDILGGLGQYVVLYARLAMNEYKRSDGTVVPYEGGFGGASRYQAGLNFAENKLAPVPSIVVDAAKGENFDREPFDPRKEIPRLFLPLGWEATADSYREYGPALAALTFGLGGVGFGVQTYSDSKKKSGKSRSKRSKPSGRSSRRGRPKP